MKSIDIKFATSQLLLIAGLAILYIGVPWSFFTGLVLVMVSAFFSVRATHPISITNRVIRIVLLFGILSFLAWFSKLGTERPPLAALIGVWIGVGVDEFRSWQKMRGWRLD